MTRVFLIMLSILAVMFFVLTAFSIYKVISIGLGATQ